jgi:CheY-like chemotaxis protein
MPKTVRVLIIEDNRDDRVLLIRQLRKINIEGHVKFIADGKEALDFLLSLTSETSEVELVAIFLDLKLPSIDGLELLQKVRETPDLKTIPVIIMTSSIDPKHVARCNELKVTGFISKPITFSSFSRAVADVFHLPSV